jgi:hypothetical protein
MTSFDGFLWERRVYDIFDSFSNEQKLELIKLYEKREIEQGR